MPKLSLAKLERHLYGATDILRREGMDAATYKDFIFGMLFLKRCSDVFEADYEKIVQKKISQGIEMHEAQSHYGENPDYYDDFFVPPQSRWSHLQSKLNDASEPFGAVMDKALVGLSEANESLRHVLDHIQFMKVQSNKRIVSDEACKDLVRHFNRYRLRNEDFQFSNLLGAAYEFLINMFAESAGKKGGDFYTPRDVIRLMVRILNPTPGMNIYDPTCGSGGMLIISREYIEQSGGDPTNLRLCGQGNDASAWSICKINMLLHGIRGADIRLEDTLLHPLHRDAGELERFDRVIANPPFSQNYTKSNMEFPERFRWGWCPTSGKKADLMFAQHMLAACKPRGMVVTVMPHGVLFRGGAEKEIREKFLQQDLIEAIISLPSNLFYGTGIPACLLIMRSNITGQTPNPNKPDNRRGRVLFINADAEYLAGRAQNYLRPEDIEKIASTFERYAKVPNYSRIVPLEEIVDEANDSNLNVRRYVDNSPSPEPHDVRAHLVGGVPFAEIARLKGEKEAFEQSNPPDDADDEELAAWNYAKDLERQAKDLKAEYKDALKELSKLEKAAAKTKATNADRKKEEASGLELKPYFDQMMALEKELSPYEQIKKDLAAARAVFRTLANAFVDELKKRCEAFSADEDQTLVLELFAQDLQVGLDGAVRDKQIELVQLFENLWDKYRVSLTELKDARRDTESKLSEILGGLDYA